MPAAVAHFAGLVDELAALDSLVPQVTDGAGGMVAISAIRGTAGVGKTALAVHWAHRVASQFPDGQLYVNLRGYGRFRCPGLPRRMLSVGSSARSGSPAERIPDSVDAQSALYRSVLAGSGKCWSSWTTRVTPPRCGRCCRAAGRCLALVTSRSAAARAGRDGRGPAGPAGRAHRRRGSRAAGQQAGRAGPRRSGRGPAADRGVCARLPLALSIVAARVAARPYLPLADLARELADAQGRLEALGRRGPGGQRTGRVLLVVRAAERAGGADVPVAGFARRAGCDRSRRRPAWPGWTAGRRPRRRGGTGGRAT